jgi:hypothetical protein
MSKRRLASGLRRLPRNETQGHFSEIEERRFENPRQGSIDVEFTEGPLSSYSGLELFRRITASSRVGNVTALDLRRPELRY